MPRMIQFFKVLFLSWFDKGKVLWKKIWNAISAQKVLDEFEDKEDVLATKYDALFSVTRTKEDVLVSERVWDRIKYVLPEEFILPNPVTTNLFTSLKADSYDMLFHKPSPTSLMYVDRDIWSRIEKNLPGNYVLPNLPFEKTLKPMSSEYYDSLIIRPPGTSEVFIENRVWEQILPNLPDQYTLPNTKSDLLVHLPLEDSCIPVVTKDPHNDSLYP